MTGKIVFLPWEALRTEFELRSKTCRKESAEVIVLEIRGRTEASQFPPAARTPFWAT